MSRVTSMFSLVNRTAYTSRPVVSARSRSFRRATETRAAMLAASITLSLSRQAGVYSRKVQTTEARITRTFDYGVEWETQDCGHEEMRQVSTDASFGWARAAL